MSEITGVMKLTAVLLLLALWLPGDLACFCCDASHPEESEQSAAPCGDFPAGPSPENGSEPCGFCCGHQVFTADILAETSDLPGREGVVAASLIYSNQHNSRSIYHPPKA